MRVWQTFGSAGLPIISWKLCCTTYNIWPANIDTSRHTLTEYDHHLHKFSKQLLPIFTLALGIEETLFDTLAIFLMAFVRPLQYPPQEVIDSNEPGTATHTDSAAFTVLYLDTVAAPEVLKKDGVQVLAPRRLPSRLSTKSHCWMFSTQHQVLILVSDVCL